MIEDLINFLKGNASRLPQHVVARYVVPSTNKVQENKTINSKIVCIYMAISYYFISLIVLVTVLCK